MNSLVSENRTKNYIRQLKGSFIFKVLALFISFLSVPYMIKYLGIEQYGIWSTLLSIISWIVLFDVGIGNGLKNKISENLAKENNLEVQKYISNAYFIIGIISLFLILLATIVIEYIPWDKVFNTNAISNSELKKLVSITVIFLFLNFWISLINQVLHGFQKSSFVVFSQFFSNLLSFLSIILLYNFSDSSLVLISLFYGLSLVFTNFTMTLWFFSKNSEYKPLLKFVSFSKVKLISSLGMKFFVLQVAAIVIFTTDKILITQLFGPEYVTSYDVVFKIFSIVTIFYGIITAPLWGSFSDAYSRQDKTWLINMLKKQIKFYLLIILTILLLGAISKYIIKIWIDIPLDIENNLVIALIIFTIISTWNMLFATFVNATNHFKVQIVTSLVAMILNIPLSIIFVKVFDLGLYSIILASAISLAIFAIFGSIETYKILRRLNESKF